MILTAENYHSPAANLEYLSVSQYKSWLSCEAYTLAWLTGQIEEEPKDAFLEGNYVHAWSEGTLDKFCVDHPEIISSRGETKGQLKKEFKVCEQMIACLKNDPKIMFYLQGQKEIILTAEMFGIPWKIKVDVLNDQLGYLLDLKTAADFSGAWVREDGKNVLKSFIEAWGYPIQAAVYSEVERIARGRDDRKDFLLAAVTKQDPPAHELIRMEDPNNPNRLQEELDKIEANIPRIMAVKSGNEPPMRCGTCKHCRTTYRVGTPKYFTEFEPA